TGAYNAGDFENYGALLSRQYSHGVLDNDGNGQVDGLGVSTGLNLYQPGTYRVEADLYDAEENFVSHATWSGAGPEVSLRFEGVAGRVGPYTLRDVTLFNSAGESIDQNGGIVYTIEAVAALA